jgi:oligopeptide/dipeptide ABC transporter ATP-binding protein
MSRLEIRDTATSTVQGEDLLQVRHLTQEFVAKGYAGVKRGVVRAVSDVSFEIQAGETLGVVGETGCGKSTLARSVLQAPKPAAGEVWFRGQDLTKLNNNALRDARRHIQMVFQDPYSSLNPRWRVTELVEEPLFVYKVGTAESRRQRAAELLDLVGLDPARHGRQRPRQLSGGQCQRVAIARALALSPDLVVYDEAVSSLDVSVQAQVLNLLEQLKADLGLSYLFIAHNLAVVKHVSDRVAVMYLGKFCEVGPAEGLYQQPLHPYTAALLAAIPEAEPTANSNRTNAHLSGAHPSPIDPPSGCRFRTRCPLAQERCAEEEPPLRVLAPGHAVACHFPLQELHSGVEDGG